MATVQSGPGRIVIFEDFIGAEWLVANTDEQPHIGMFKIIGDTLDDTDAGVEVNDTDPCLSGVARLTTPNGTDNDHISLATAKMFNVAKMAPIVAETRVQFDDLDTKEFYFGFTNVNGDTDGLEGTNIHGATETLTLSSSHLCGFFLSSELNDDQDWHAAYNGGTTTGEVTSTSVDLDADATADEWQVLRLEIDPNGTARWLVDGVLLKTVEGAVSTTTNLGLRASLEVKDPGSCETCDIDYILIEANRDWTV